MFALSWVLASSNFCNHILIRCTFWVFWIVIGRLRRKYVLVVAVSSIVRYFGSVGLRCSIRSLMRTTTLLYRWKRPRNMTALPVSIHSKTPPWNRCCKSRTFCIRYIHLSPFLMTIFWWNWVSPSPFIFLLSLFPEAVWISLTKTRIAKNEKQQIS